MKMIGFWDIVLCNLVVADGPFRGAYCRHHQDDESDKFLLEEQLCIS
jgi:hypothetical protein